MNSVLREIENGCFSPLIFNTLGGMGPTAQVVYKRLADLIADKLHKPYNTIIQLIRCRLCFSLLHSTITCFERVKTSKDKFLWPIHNRPSPSGSWGAGSSPTIIIIFLVPFDISSIPYPHLHCLIDMYTDKKNLIIDIHHKALYPRNRKFFYSCVAACVYIGSGCKAPQAKILVTRLKIV